MFSFSSVCPLSQDAVPFLFSASRVRPRPIHKVPRRTELPDRRMRLLAAPTLIPSLGLFISVLSDSLALPDSAIAPSQ